MCGALYRQIGSVSGSMGEKSSMARTKRTNAMRVSRTTMAYVDGNTVRKVQPKRRPNPEELERRELARKRERQRILAEREMEYRAQQDRLRHKSVALDVKYIAVLITASVFTLGLCFSYIQMQTSINTRISSIEAKKQQLDQLKSENDALQNSIDTSVNLDEIYRVATQELGMVYAGKDQTITYDKTESEYVRQYEDIPKY